nr:GDSL esterase/lipase At5g45960 isoform X3 [Arachis hypogaea]
MGTFSSSSFLFLAQIFFILWQLLCLTVEAFNNSSNNKISAFYVFGDSTVDPGNNNYIDTPFKCNFPPYGMDFPNHVPTGRFCNGKLATDYIASYAGLKKSFLPAYLDPNLSVEELITGKQLEYFRECKKKLEVKLGKEGTKNHLEKAVFFLSAGTNDFVLNYFALPIRRKSFTILSYQQFLIQHVKQFIQDVVAEGGRKIAVAGVPPMGCLPLMITLNSPNDILHRHCIDHYSSIARDYNHLLQQELHLFQFHLNNNNISTSPTKIYYVDIYGPLAQMIQAPQKFGFDEVGSGCCGSGYIEASVLCNKFSGVCLDPSKYVFWDSIHPTDKAYHNLFLAKLPTIDFIING